MDLVRLVRDVTIDITLKTQYKPVARKPELNRIVICLTDQKTLIRMEMKVIIGVLILAFIAGAAVFALSGQGGTSGTLINHQNVQTSTIRNQTNTNSSKVLFAATQYAQYSYQIYPDPISPQARAALTGFNITSTTLQKAG